MEDIKLLCIVGREEYSLSECEYKADQDGAMTLMCPLGCQYEDPNELEIVGTTTEGTVYEDSYDKGNLLWWMNEELYDLVTAPKESK